MTAAAPSATASSRCSLFCSGRRPLPLLLPFGIEEDDFLGVDLGAVTALAVLRLERVLGEGAGHVEAVALPHVLRHGLGLLAPADDGVPVGLRLAVLAAAVGGEAQLADGGAALAVLQVGVGPDAA